MDSKETHQQQQQNRNNNAAALADPTSTSQAVQHNRSSVGALSPRQTQPQRALMINASPYSAATQQPWMQPGNEQQARGDSDGDANAAPPAAKRPRGRPPGSRTKNRCNYWRGGEGGPLKAHVIDVNPGEDIAMKLVAFMNQEPRDVCILSASGDVSRAVFHSKNPIGLVRLQGQYVITSMSGTFSNTESNGTVTRTGTLSVSLAGPDYMVVGGCVGAGGSLVAASEVEVIVGTFGPEGVKPSAASSAPANVSGLPQSQGPQRSSESSEENASTSLGNSTALPPHHLPLWPGNNPQ